jgi:transposase
MAGGKDEERSRHKGVGLLTAAILIAETQGVKLITDGKQLVSYAGYDVEKENRARYKRTNQKYQ